MGLSSFIPPASAGAVAPIATVWLLMVLEPARRVNLGGLKPALSEPESPLLGLRLMETSMVGAVRPVREERPEGFGGTWGNGSWGASQD
jgi:hypothetical protein